jgi:predicted ATPase
MDRKPNHRIPDPEVRWKNFRCFRDTGWLIIRPLTILIGPNNAGKTSVIAPLLLLNQTLLSRDVVTPLVMRGPSIDAGTFRDIVFNHDTKLDVFFGVRFHSHDRDKSTKKVGAYAPGALEVTFSQGKTPQASVLKRYVVYDIFKRLYLKRIRLSSGRYTLTGIQTHKLTTNERRALRRSRPSNFLFSILSEFYELRGEPPDILTRFRFSSSFQEYMAILSHVSEHMNSLFNTLSYIGPLRERPKRYYEALGETIETVGPAGERAPNILRRRFSELRQGLNRWIRRFEMGQEVRYRDLSDDIFEINFLSKQSPSITNIADAGFGASQVLPLIVQAVAAEPMTITVAEQPEIHLNPRLQCVLADLFVEMANTNHRIIVETHSEHLFLRLRRLVATGKISHNDIAIYFVEKGEGQSIIRPVPLQKNGHIQHAHWPVNFFGETLRESLALAAAQASK